jgi:hypothetical protein
MYTAAFIPIEERMVIDELVAHLSGLGMQIRVEIHPAKSLKGGHYGGIQQVHIPYTIRSAGLSD